MIPPFIPDFLDWKLRRSLSYVPILDLVYHMINGVAMYKGGPGTDVGPEQALGYEDKCSMY